MNSMTEALVTIATAIVGVAILAVLVGKNSQTASVIQAGGSAFSTALGVAENPVTGGTGFINPTQSGGGLNFSSLGLG